jgi:TonB family protein
MTLIPRLATAAAVLLLAAAPLRAQGPSATTPREPDVQPVLATRNLPLLTQRAYPPRLRSHPIPGSADVRMKILENGRVDSASVSVETSTSPEFAAAAMQVAVQLRFRPAQLAGEPVPVWVTYPIHFGPLSDGTSTVTQQDKRLFPYRDVRHR